MTEHTTHIEGYDAPKVDIVEQEHLQAPEMPDSMIGKARAIKFAGHEADRVLSHCYSAGWAFCDAGLGTINLTMGAAEDAANDLVKEVKEYVEKADAEAGKDSTHLEVAAELRYLRWRCDVALRKAWTSEMGSLSARGEVSSILKSAAERVEGRY